MASRLAARLLPAAIFALAATLAIPAQAEDRAVKTKVPAIYPEFAKRVKAQGIVTVEATVDAAGKVTAAKALSGPALLKPPAEDAVRKWTFEPGQSTATVKVDLDFVF